MRVYLALLMISLPVLAGDNEADNGGDYYAMEFTRAAQTVLLHLHQTQSLLLSKDELTKFAAAIKATRVHAKEGELVDNSGRRVDARVVTDSNGKKVIEIDRKRWMVLFEKKNIYALVFHEYLRIIGVNDDNYVLSKKLYEGVSPIDSEIPIDSSKSYFNQLKKYFKVSKVVSWKYLKNLTRQRAFQTICFWDKSNEPIYAHTRFFERRAGDLFPPIKKISYKIRFRLHHSKTVYKKNGSLVAEYDHGNRNNYFRVYNKKFVIMKNSERRSKPRTFYMCYNKLK